MTVDIQENKQVIVAIDSQKLDAIQKCAYYYKLSFLDNLRPKITPDYFEKGDLLHFMLEQFYTFKQNRSAWPQNGLNYNSVVQECINKGREYAVKMNTEISELEKVIDAFVQYTDYYENDDWSDSKIYSIEKVKSVLLFESPQLVILYEGKIDLSLDFKGTPVPVDHKSASARRDPNELSNQFKGYCWLLGSHKMIVNEIGFQKSLKPSEKFRRHIIQYSQAVLDEWRDNAIFWVRLTLGLMDQNTFPKNYTSCDKYSGCSFKDLCILDPEVREYKMHELYDIKPWDIGKNHL